MRSHRSTSRGTYLVLLLAGAVVACSDATPPAPAGRFARIQSEILDGSCAGCHDNSANPAAGLSLTAGHSLANLVGSATTNDDARADGLKRITPSSPEMSLLYRKLSFTGWPAGRNYGSPMPLGLPSLSIGQMEFVRQWIAAGAPLAGEVVKDTMLLRDQTRPAEVAFTALAPPAQGVQLHIDQFGITPKFERELFLRRNLNNAADLYITRIETKMRVNSHHFLLYTFQPTIPAIIVPAPDVVRDIRNPDGSMIFANMLVMGYHVFFAGSMTQTSDYRFPAGVALKVPANATFDLNSHFINKSTASIVGEAYANLHTVDRSQVQRVASTLNMANTSLTLPPGQRTTITKTFLVDSTITVFMLTSHMHARGEKFVVKISGGARNGQVVYENIDWEHPAITNLATPLVLQKGEGLTSEVTYNNTTTRTIVFGLTSEDEMDIIFGYYYGGT